MSRLKTLLAILYRFIVGDDATIALAVVAALALTAALTALGLSAWWLLPATVIGTLAMSLKRDTGNAQVAHPRIEETDAG